MGKEAFQPLTAAVVIDDPTQLGMLCGLERKAGLEVRPFGGTVVALAAMSPEAPPDLVVTDLFMLDIDGWRSFCRLLRSPECMFCNEVPILNRTSWYRKKLNDSRCLDKSSVDRHFA